MTDIAPFSESERVRFHFQFDAAYLTMSEVVRDIEVSHWGNVRIEESFLLQHDGAKLKGPYEVGMYDRVWSLSGTLSMRFIIEFCTVIWCSTST